MLEYKQYTQIPSVHKTLGWSNDRKWISGRGISHHVNGLVDGNILDLVHLNECSGLTAWGVAARHLNAQRANDKQGLVFYLHKVDVKHHANQGDEYSTGQNSCILQEKEHIYMEV